MTIFINLQISIGTSSLDYYTRPISNNVPITQEVNEINTLIKPKKDEVQCSSTIHIYENIRKELPREIFGQFFIFLRKSNKLRISTTRRLN